MIQTPKDFVLSCFEKKEDGVIIKTSAFDTKDQNIQKIFIKFFKNELAQNILQTCGIEQNILYKTWKQNQNQKFYQLLHELEFRYPEITPFSLHIVCVFSQENKTISFIQNKNKHSIRTFSERKF